MLEDLSMGMRGVASTNCPKVSINDNTHNTTDQLHNGQNNPTKFDKVDSGISGEMHSQRVSIVVSAGRQMTEIKQIP